MSYIPNLAFVENIKKWCLKLFSKMEYRYLGALVCTYTIVMSYFTTARMYAFKASAWDLGNYNQAIYTFVFNGKLFYWTADLLGNPSGTLFGVHFSPMFFLLAIPYRLFPGPETLLVIQSLWIAIGAIPVYLLTLQELRSRNLALLLPLLYLLYPPLLGVNWFDFHPEAFIPTAFLFVIYFYRTQKWTKASLAVLFALSTMNEAGLLLNVLGISFLIEKRTQLVALFHRRRLSGLQSVVFSLLMVVVGITWFVTSTWITDSLNPIGAGLYGANFATLGVQTITQIPVIVITNPARGLAALLQDWQLKATFLFLLVESFLFIPLLAPLALLPALVWIIPALLSSNLPYYSVGLQYSAFIIPFIVFALILGLKRALPRFRPKRLLCSLVIATAFGLILSNPLLSLKVATHPWAHYGVPSALQAERRLVALVPSNETVMTTDQFVFPFISNRPNAYVVPATIPYVGLTFFDYIDSLVNKSDYIILNMNYQFNPHNALVLSRTNGDFGVLGYANGLLLLKRGFCGVPLMNENPPSLTFNYKNLTIRSAVVSPDPTSSSGYVFNSTSDGVPGSDFWWGPYFPLTPGTYRVDVRLKEEYPIKGDVLTLQATAFPVAVNGNFMYKDAILNLTATSVNLQGVTFTKTVVTGDMLNSETYSDVSYNFTADTYGIYEFTGLSLQTDLPIYLDRITVKMTRPLSYVRPIPISFANSPPIYYDFNHSRSIVKTASLIPMDAKALFQNDLLPLVMKKGRVPLLPTYGVNDTEAYLRLLDSMLNSTDYLLLDWKANDTLCSLILSRPAISTIFNLRAWNDGVMLFQRNYKGSMAFDNPYNAIVDWSHITLKQGTWLEESNGTTVLVHFSTNVTDFWWGPYMFLPSGTYNATLWLRSDHNLPNGTAFTFGVNIFPFNFSTTVTNGALTVSKAPTGQKIVLVRHNVTGQEIGVSEYTRISFSFDANYYGAYEFPGLSVMVSEEIYVSRIQITMTQPGSPPQIHE